MNTQINIPTNYADPGILRNLASSFPEIPPYVAKCIEAAATEIDKLTLRCTELERRLLTPIA